MQEATRAAVNAVENLPQPEKEEALQAFAEANPAFIPTGDDAKVSLWNKLIIGLFVVTLVAIVASVWLALQDKDYAAFVGIATGAIGGVLGLFSKSPTQ